MSVGPGQVWSLVGEGQTLEVFLVVSYDDLSSGRYWRGLMLYSSVRPRGEGLMCMDFESEMLSDLASPDNRGASLWRRLT